ncbi:hypothetical protein E4J66_07855 [Actinomyces viscosus]|uniref:Uncharacterized protein n=1 Tax=Actinomyces viscosus TaxID=1656 RepID=A0A448PMG3_ACTVI|nr:hypothetical protein [Actinomyces viscosus]TFH52418.1 hypothetical protein E4J66_07855 [Actinomyces viscosus]VEI17195.1 Uncharacterised protein [Actinomyces viscosus]
MSSFDADRGVMILDPEQWDVLQRMVTGPVAERANYAEGVLAGLEDIGVIDPYGPTLAASEVLAGLMAADARYSLRRMDPRDPMPVRDIVFWLNSPRCTVERYDTDGIHVYGCDDVEVPHIALANDNLYPRPMIDDGPDDIYDTLAAAVRLGDVQAAEANMNRIGYGGPKASQFVWDARDGRWTIVLHSREDRDRDKGFVPTEQLMTLGVTTMLYVIEEDSAPVVDPNGPSQGIPLIPVSATEAWGHISSWMWATR